MSEHFPPPPAPRPKVDLSPLSLLWIAIIVGVCAGGGHRSHKGEFDRLNERIERLEKKIDQLTAAQKRASAPSSAAATPAR
jgi:hypothetical protein